MEEIDLKRERSSFQIQSKDTSWKECGQDLKVRIEYFTDKLHMGQKARAHLFFAGGKEMQNQIDAITIETRFTANGGRFRSDNRIAGIAPSVISAGVYVYRLDPWQPIEGSEQNVQSGEGAVTISLLFQKKKGDNLSTIHRLDFNEVTIPVVAPTRN